MEWKISGMEWNCMEDFACYGRWKIYITFHSMPCQFDHVVTFIFVSYLNHLRDNAVHGYVRFLSKCWS